ncbi:MAG: thiamine diphosphokinase [Armatimonadetes bacterium]|nr:thiamine diphosphokinase [Armatimonadota bacterium]
MKHRVLGVLAGGDLDSRILRAWADSADFIIAADGAADLLLGHGVSAHITIGDLDSLSESSRSRLEVIHDPDQDTTDADKLLALAHAQGHRSITLAGVEGDLPDHVLAVLSSAARSPLQIRMVYRRGVAWIVRQNDRLEVSLPETGRRVSLLPVVPSQVELFSGVEWPLADSPLAMDTMVSISNRAVERQISVQLRSGVAWLFAELPPDHLPFWTN